MTNDQEKREETTPSDQHSNHLHPVKNLFHGLIFHIARLEICREHSKADIVREGIGKIEQSPFIKWDLVLRKSIEDELTHHRHHTREGDQLPKRGKKRKFVQVCS